MIKIEANNSEIKRLLKELESTPQKIQTAARKSINATLTQAKKRIPKFVTSKYNISAAAVRKTINIRRASGNSLQGQIVSSGRGTPLINFKIRTAWNRRKTRKRGAPVRRKIVNVSIEKGKWTRTPFFVATMKSGHKGIFHRLNNSRLPIGENFGPSVPTMIGKRADELQKELGAYYAESMEKNLQNSLNKK